MFVAYRPSLLVPRHGRVDLGGPAVDAAGDRACAGDAVGVEGEGGAEGALPVVAEDEQGLALFGKLLDLVESLFELAHGDVARAGEACLLKFRIFTDVEQWRPGAKEAAGRLRRDFETFAQMIR